MTSETSLNPTSIEEIARNALAESAGTVADSVPSQLVRAIAHGEGVRAEVAAAARRFGGEVALDLVRFDTDRIGAYVFESNRPPVLAGASKILRDLNAEIARDHSQQCLFSAGGEGLLLVPGGQGAALCDEIEERFRRDSVGALGLTTAWISVRPEDFVRTGTDFGVAEQGVRLVSGTQAVLSRLHDSVRRKKDERLPLRAPVAGNRPRCLSCRDRSEGSTSLQSLGRESEIGSICDPCARRWKQGRKLIAGTSFEELIDRWTGTRAEGARKGNYLGFLYADGNAMGALFGRLLSLAELQTLSQDVTSCFDSLRDRVAEEVGRMFPAAGNEPDEKLFLDLLAGGDEVIWILPAGLAVHVAERLPAWLDDEVARRKRLVELLGRYGRSRLTVGIGLALTGLGYPVRYQYQLAKALQKEAKQRAYLSEREESTIDFELLTDSSPLSEDLPSLRRWLSRTAEKDFFRTCRPFSRDEMTRLRVRIEQAVASELALSQLYTLSAGSTEGRRPFLNLVRYQLARKPAAEKYQRWLGACGVEPSRPEQIEEFFVQPTANGSGLWIDDALDLLPFLGGLERLRGERR